MSAKEEAMFQEALSAVEQGNDHRARDLLARLLKIDQKNPQYWLWMSAVVESNKERSVCLKNVLKLDPENAAARQGLILLGELPPDDSLAIPMDQQIRDWQSKMPHYSSFETYLLSGAWMPLAVIGGIILALLIFGFGGLFVFKQVARWINPEPTLPVIFLAEPTEVYNTSMPGTEAVLPTLIGPTPLADFLYSTYTPTPLYVDTPHPSSESYRSAMFDFRKGDYESAVLKLEELTAEEPQAYDLYYHLGEAYRFQEKYTQALNAYAEALRLDPSFAAAYLGRARARIASAPGSWQTALADLEKAVSLDPNLGEAYIEIAAIQLSHSEPPALALENLEKAAALMPDSVLVEFYTAQAYLMMSDMEQALQHAQRAAELDFTFLEGYRLLGEVYYSSENLLDAMWPLRTYTQYAVEDAEAWYWLGEAYLAFGAVEESLSAFGSAIEADRLYNDAYIARGEIYYDQGRYDLAEKAFKSALDIRVDSFTANFLLGCSLYELENYAPASFYFDRSQAYVETEQEFAQLYYWRALTMEALNQPAAAMRDWQALLDLTPGSYSAEWRKLALEHVEALATVTATSNTSTITSTRKPTLTISITSTRKPTLTVTISPTRKPTLTNTATPTPVPTRTSSNTPSKTPTRTPSPMQSLGQTSSPAGNQ